MSDEINSPPKGLREEAATWFAIMRGPEADAKRPEFEEWLARGALHRSAYNRIAETFSLGKSLKTSRLSRDLHKDPEIARVVRGSVHLWIGVGSVVAAAVAGMVWIGLSSFWSGENDRSITQPRSAQTAPGSTRSSAEFATRVGEIKNYALSDGSTITLDSDSMILVFMTAANRDLRLIRGRARFTVAHESRPFIVAAAGGTVTARGTVFDVAIDHHDHVTVRLLRGAVDVKLPDRAPRSAASPEFKRMRAGETVRFGEASTSPGDATFNDSSQWPDGIRDLDRVPLQDLVADANRYATKALVLASPDLERLHLSGTFRVRDTRKLAENIGDLLSLAVIDRGNTLVLARACSERPQETCRPPS